MRKRLISIGGDYTIEDAGGNVLYDVDRKVRFATTFTIKDREGRKLISAKEKLLALDGTMIFRRDGAVLATLRTVGGIVNPKSFRIEVANGAEITATGTFLGDDYVLTRQGQNFASVRQEPSRLRELFRIDIAGAEDVPLVLAFVASIAMMVPRSGEDT